ncbi:TPA: hypothetical protein HJU08_004337 [Escherichia coli]|uniref:hypothetical protein n=2 Tax=Escherichia coli TaxID=562 RepID=UPI0013B40B88|nr:hypothetical protein [Escherichia coli]EEC2098388.1 hypothetical protein [Salmonella enterica subsp. enterica serovar Enteritidis]EEN3323268.1 hypothetical protein [Salmonella enterica subsp. enterica serovar Enteritidis]EHI6992659.1 hypothetical protein [Escherichia coli]MCX8342623.1 hypothetical protein [Escherichia coli]HAI3339597.1 hypothetical protein [Escherichia coli]
MGKKFSAFVELIDLTYKMKRSREYWFSLEEHSRYYDENEYFKRLNDDEEESLRKEERQAMKEIVRISHLSSFTLSDNTSTLLNIFLMEHNKIHPLWWIEEIDGFEVAQKELHITETLLEQLLREATKVLKGAAFGKTR